MKIEFEKIYKTNSSIPSIFAFPIFLVLIPLILVGIALVLIWAFLGLFFSNGRKKSDVGKAVLSDFLIEKDNFNIELVELDEQEYSRLADYWYSKVYDEDTTLYLAKTSPEIPGIHNQVITTFIKEIKEGVMLQIVEYPEFFKEPISKIIYLEYSSLKIEVLDLIGPYFLFNDDKEEDIIEGFNQRGKIQLRIKLPDGDVIVEKDNFNL